VFREIPRCGILCRSGDALVQSEPAHLREAGPFSLSSTCTIEMTFSKGEALKLVRVVAPHFRGGL
jgi:hypothetical protein